eukprot:TRINITY_DN2182_c1_g6_i1.p1 TRINITY_DN2182_c1_g6~~TRINITY_DN2182_c1_g6_i1.p1  ORF type:complete len:104 (+),score=35.04 TRINITY_DN2182_c1_g6_i1:113-424(+)
MAARRASFMLTAAVLLVAFWGLNQTFVAAPGKVAPQQALRGADIQLPAAGQAAALGAALATVPDAAHAANQGYALLQLGWAVFIISLGPAVLFYIYFNKPELL